MGKAQGVSKSLSLCHVASDAPHRVNFRAFK